MWVDSNELVSASAVSPDRVTYYRIAYCPEHPTLKVGDVVVMGETPSFVNVFIKDDLTLHQLQSKAGYVLVVPETSLPKAHCRV